MVRSNAMSAACCVSVVSSAQSAGESHVEQRPTPSPPLHDLCSRRAHKYMSRCMIGHWLTRRLLLSLLCWRVQMTSRSTPKSISGQPPQTAQSQPHAASALR